MTYTVAFPKLLKFIGLGQQFDINVYHIIKDSDICCAGYSFFEELSLSWIGTRLRILCVS